MVVDDAWLDRIRTSIGELPAAARQRFETDYGLSPYDANVLVEQGQDVADYYDAVAKATGEFKLASNWIQQDVLRTIKEKKLTVAEFPVRPDQLADLINRVKAGELNTNQGREVLGKMIETGETAEAIIAERRLPDGLRPRRDRRSRRGRHRRQSPGHRGPEEGEEKARRRQGISPRPGNETDRRQGQPRAGRRAARIEARGTAGLNRARRQSDDLRLRTLHMPRTIHWYRRDRSCHDRLQIVRGCRTPV